MRRTIFLLIASLSMFTGAQATPIITTYAGGGPNNLPAIAANVGLPNDIAADASGNLFITVGDTQISGEGRVYRIDATGRLTHIAGSTMGFAFALTGEGGPATQAILVAPEGIAVDAQGNVFIAEPYTHRIRRVDGATGIITTYAGSGGVDVFGGGFAGDGGSATSALLSRPQGVALDAAGNLLIADTGNSRIRRVDAATGVITTVTAFLPPPAFGPLDLRVDSQGNMFASFQGGVYRVQKGTGAVSVVAGFGTGPSGDGSPAVGAALGFVWSVILDGQGNLYLTNDVRNDPTRGPTVLQVSGGLLTRVAGDGVHTGYSGDGGPATDSTLNQPQGIAFDSSGGLVISDHLNNRIRRVDSAGIIQTMAGNGTILFGGDGFSAEGASMYFPQGVARDRSGNVLIADTYNDRVRRVDAATGVLTTIAGGGSQPITNWGDGGPATNAVVPRPNAIAADSLGNVYISFPLLNSVRRVDAVTGIIDTFQAGLGGQPRYLGLAFDSDDNLYIANDGTHLVFLKGSPCGLCAVAGTGIQGFSGDGGQATAASLNKPLGIAVDSAKNLYIVDSGNQRIRRVDHATGIITTVAGNGVKGFSGDNGPATAASLSDPWAISMDGDAAFLLTDKGNFRVRRVSLSTGTITTVAGNGANCPGTDGIPATDSPLCGDQMGVASDGTGSFLVADSGNFRVRRVGVEPLRADAGSDRTQACGEPVSLDGSRSTAPGSTPGTNDTIVSFEWFEHFGEPSQTLLGTGETLQIPAPSPGTHVYTLRITNLAGDTATDEVIVTVQSAPLPPEITIGLSPSVLRPANHKMVDIVADVQVTNQCGGAPVIVLTSITSDEPDDAPGPADGSTINDIQGAALGTADFHFQLRAERSQDGNGRVYTVTYMATDSFGQSASAAGSVLVPLKRTQNRVILSSDDDAGSGRTIGPGRQR